ncbi:MAG TPA: hypothetical protein VM182_01910, partial [Terriglobia bacterium]|nr:hypothetical protein [Terriglobia bacterium]
MTRTSKRSVEFAGYELRGLQTGNRRRATEFLRCETLRYLLASLGFAGGGAREFRQLSYCGCFSLS